MKRIDERPQHARIAADLRAKILAGDITGTLPTYTRLQELYDTTTNTAQRAVALLKAEGFVEGKRGKALYIRSDRIRIVDAASQLEPPASTITYQVLHIGHERPPADAALKLGLAEGETALLRKRLMLRDDEPVELEWSYYPEHIVTGTALDQRAITAQPNRDLATAPTPSWPPWAGSSTDSWTRSKSANRPPTNSRPSKSPTRSRSCAPSAPSPTRAEQCWR